MLCPNPEPTAEIIKKDSKKVNFFIDKGIYWKGSNQWVLIPGITIKNYSFACDGNITHRTFGVMFEFMCFYAEIYWEWNR